MNLSSLLEKVAGKQRNFQADFGGLVRRLADGQELDAAVVVRTSACAELESELQTLSQRRIELCRQRDELRNAGRLELERAVAAGSSSEQEGLEERGRQRLRQAEALAKELTWLDKRSAELQQREQLIREKMFQP